MLGIIIIRGHVGSVRFFRYQHVGIGNANVSYWGITQRKGVCFLVEYRLKRTLFM